MEPKVSIIIPVYNGADYMREAINSALAQTYKNLEVIVINDGSDDEGRTQSIAREYGDRIVYYHKKNGGVASALNLGIRKMTGEYFSWLSHDDMYYENKIEVQMNYLKKCDETVITYCNFEVIDENSRQRGVKRLKPVAFDQFRYSITVNSLVHGCTFMVPKVCFEECGFFNEALKTTQDYDMWFRLAGKYKMNHTPDILVKSRFHAGQGSHKLKDTAEREIDDLMIKQLHSLSEEEITGATKMPLSLSYAYIAKSFDARGISRAKSLALELSEERRDALSLKHRLMLFILMNVQTPIAKLLNLVRVHIVYPLRALRQLFL